MPIWKNEKDNVLMIETGFGDVSFATGKTPDKDYSDELLFSQGPVGEIGREDTYMVGKSSVEAGTACRVVFHKRASLDVLLERLNYLRSQMPDDAPSAPSEEPCICASCDLVGCAVSCKSPKCAPAKEVR